MKSPSVLVDEFKACVLVVAVVIDTVFVVVILNESFSSKKNVLNEFYGLVLSFTDVCTFCFVIFVAYHLVGDSVPFIAGLRVGILEH